MTANAKFICNAIQYKQRIRFVYNNKPRVGEPQCCGVSTAGKEIVRVHLVEGGSRPEQLFEISKMQSLELIEQFFSKPGPNYSRNDSAMKEIYSQL